ncbi:hypothetical protein L7F22_008153 [Adiantum nelumboides]|nr:hypothetical protein [Adiantum nelumboides]
MPPFAARPLSSPTTGVGRAGVGSPRGLRATSCASAPSPFLSFSKQAAAIALQAAGGQVGSSMPPPPISSLAAGERTQVLGLQQSAWLRPFCRCRASCKARAGRSSPTGHGILFYGQGMVAPTFYTHGQGRTAIAHPRFLLCTLRQGRDYAGPPVRPLSLFFSASRTGRQHPSPPLLLMGRAAK